MGWQDTLKLRRPDRDSLIKLGSALILTWITFGGYILVNILGLNLSPPTFIILIAITILLFYMIIDNVYKKLNMSSSIDEMLLDDIDEETGEDESAFLVWLLMERIISTITKERMKVTIHVIDDGIPLITYPLNQTTEIETIEESNELTIRKGNGAISITIPLQLYHTIKNLINRRDGEAIEAREQEDIETIYKLINKITQELNKGANPTLIHYITYKTLIKLYKNGTIEMNDKLLYNIQTLDKDTKNKILQQLKEEKLL